MVKKRDVAFVRSDDFETIDEELTAAMSGLDAANDRVLTLLDGERAAAEEDAAEEETAEEGAAQPAGPVDAPPPPKTDTKQDAPNAQRVEEH